MNTKLLALFFLLQQNLKTKEGVQKELSNYTTEYLFKIMREGDKNPSFRPELVFEVIEQRGDYTGEQLIVYLNHVMFAGYNGRFKVEVCAKLLKRDDYTPQNLRHLFHINNGRDGNHVHSVLVPSLCENQPLLLLKLTSYSFDELLEISETRGFFWVVAEMAKTLAEEKLSALSTTDLLLLENRGIKVRVDKELANRVCELGKLVSL